MTTDTSVGTSPGNEPDGDDRAPYFVRSVERSMLVIRSFGAGNEELSVADVARNTGLTRAATRRFLRTLVDLGYAQSDGRYFSLTPKVLALGYAYLSGMSLPEVAQPHLEQLVEEVEESSEVSILDGEEIVYIVRVPGPKIMTVSINVGARMPAHATSMGRVLLAGLDDPELSTYLATATLKRFLPGTITTSEELRARIVEARDQGWAIIDQELEEGLRAVAAPIRDRQGNVVAAVNLSTHAARHSMESLRDTLLPHLLVAARRIESDLHMAAAAHPRDRRRRDRT